MYSVKKTLKTFFFPSKVQDLLKSYYYKFK